MDLVHQYLSGKKNKSDLSRDFGVSRPTVDKWLERYSIDGESGLRNKSRRPHRMPKQLSTELELRILELRDEVPQWGARKIQALLSRELTAGQVPAVSTVGKVLKRNNRISQRASDRSKPWQRFEYEHPNDLWQMDFKGDFVMNDGERCYPLTVIDDHSRFNIGLIACADQKLKTVQNQTVALFEEYGLPWMMLTDNGPPWGAAGVVPEYGDRAYTAYEIWLMMHGVKLIHGRPYHPQTQGKDERFHRTMDEEILNHTSIDSMQSCQAIFGAFRSRYNNQRPHEGIDMMFPSERYRPSTRKFEAKIRKPEYDQGSELRCVSTSGHISYKGKVVKVGKAFRNKDVGVSFDKDTGTIEIKFYNNVIRELT